jgi:hypothetical protein
MFNEKIRIRDFFTAEVITDSIALIALQVAIIKIPVCWGLES